MPFSRECIEKAYEIAPLRTEGNFAKEFKKAANYKMQQARYRELEKHLSPEHMRLVNAYLTCVGAEMNVTEMHYFEQGWLACEKMKKHGFVPRSVFQEYCDSLLELDGQKEYKPRRK